MLWKGQPRGAEHSCIFSQLREFDANFAGRNRLRPI
jgi:hypothetical protein